MPRNTKIEYEKIDNLYLDPLNPRLGRNRASKSLKQEAVLDCMQDWTLDELALSFIENGFWAQEAVIVATENLYGKDVLVVIEGNRRIAALKMLQKAVKKEILTAKWTDLANCVELSDEIFTQIPYIKVESRDEVSSFLGFRHVTGIKEWRPAEKAQFITKLIDEKKLSYDEVRKKIGSKAPTVRQNYISYKLLLQIEDSDDLDVEEVENRFSVLYLSLRTLGVQKYLNIDIKADPDAAEKPVPDDHLENLAKFSNWLFGNENKKIKPLFTDSRYVDDFGKILESQDAIYYLERNDRPSFSIAMQKSGVGQDNLIDLLARASDNVKLAMSEIHHHKGSNEIQRAIKNIGIDVYELLSRFPAIKQEIIDQLGEE